MRAEFRVRLLRDGGEKFFGEGPYRLLRGVERLGSLRAAASEQGMAYSKAYRIVRRAEQALGFPLTERRIGGPDGGGSALTLPAQELLARYEALRSDCEAALAASFARNFTGFPPPGKPPARAGNPTADSPRLAGKEPVPKGNPPAGSSGELPLPEVEAISADFPRLAGEESVPAGNPPAGSSGELPLPEEEAVSANSTRLAGEEPAPEGNPPAESSGELSLSEGATVPADSPRLVGEAVVLEGNPPAGSSGELSLPDGTTVPADSPRLVGEAAVLEGNCGDGPALGCVVLAAGRAERFGGGKLLAKLGGEAVLARTLAALPRERFRKLVAVTSDPAVSALCRGAGVDVREYPGGPLSESIREGLVEMSDTDGCMFVNGDQPLLRPDSLRRLAGAFAQTPACAHRLAWGGTAASPAILPASAYPALRELTGESGGMAALRGGNWEIRAVEAEGESELWDVDDPEALRRAEAYLEARPRA